MLSGPGELADLRVCVGLCADLPLQDSLGLLKAVVPVISLIMKSNILKTSWSFCNDMVVYLCFVSLADTTKK